MSYEENYREQPRGRGHATSAGSTLALLDLRAPIAIASLVRFGSTSADRARPALRLRGGQLVCRLVYQAGRRTAIHSCSWAAVGPTCSLLAASTSVLVSTID